MPLHKSLKIKAVILDWGGVCCSGGEIFASSALQNYLNLTPEQITTKIQSVYHSYYQGQLSQDQFWQAATDRLNLPPLPEFNPASLSQAYLNSYTLYPEILTIVKKIRPQYQTALLSNLTPEMRDYIIKKHSLKEYFSEMVFSCDKEISTLKPSPKPFTFIVSKLNLAPSDCLFIDDSLNNINSANTLGFKTLLFTHRQKLRRFLLNLINYKF